MSTDTHRVTALLDNVCCEVVVAVKVITSLQYIEQVNSDIGA